MKQRNYVWVVEVYSPKLKKWVQPFYSETLKCAHKYARREKNFWKEKVRVVKFVRAEKETCKHLRKKLVVDNGTNEEYWWCGSCGALGRRSTTTYKLDWKQPKCI